MTRYIHSTSVNLVPAARLVVAEYQEAERLGVTNATQMARSTTAMAIWSALTGLEGDAALATAQFYAAGPDRRDPELPRNTMTILEFPPLANIGPLADRVEDAYAEDQILRLAVEVEPDGAVFLKAKVGNGMWSLPMTPGEVTTERLYAED